MLAAGAYIFSIATVLTLCGVLGHPGLGRMAMLFPERK